MICSCNAWLILSEMEQVYMPVWRVLAWLMDKRLMAPSPERSVRTLGEQTTLVTYLIKYPYMEIFYMLMPGREWVRITYEFAYIRVLLPMCSLTPSSPTYQFANLLVRLPTTLDYQFTYLTSFLAWLVHLPITSSHSSQLNSFLYCLSGPWMAWSSQSHYQRVTTQMAWISSTPIQAYWVGKLVGRQASQVSKQVILYSG